MNLPPCFNERSAFCKILKFISPILVLDLNEQNIESEDVVYVRGAGNIEGINLEKAWLRDRRREGLKFKKLIINGRSWRFIEYLPAENAWRPIGAATYMFIDCIWVIGRHWAVFLAVAHKHIKLNSHVQLCCLVAKAFLGCYHGTRYFWVGILADMRAGAV